MLVKTTQRVLNREVGSILDIDEKVFKAYGEKYMEKLSKKEIAEYNKANKIEEVEEVEEKTLEEEKENKMVDETETIKK